MTRDPDQTSDLQLLHPLGPQPDSHWRVRTATIDFFNQTWLNYVGRKIEDLVGWRWTAFIHPEDVERNRGKSGARLPGSRLPPSCMKLASRCGRPISLDAAPQSSSTTTLPAVAKWYGSSIDGQGIVSRRKCSSDVAPWSFKEANSISPKGSGLPIWGAGRSILPDSTTGLRNCFGCTASTRSGSHLRFKNTWIAFTRRIESLWQSFIRASRAELRPSTLPSASCDAMARSDTFAAWVFLLSKTDSQSTLGAP